MTQVKINARKLGVNVEIRFGKMKRGSFIDKENAYNICTRKLDVKKNN